MQGTQDAVIIDIWRELGQKVHSYTMHPCKQLMMCHVDYVKNYVYFV